jgi:hypothetical protein
MGTREWGLLAWALACCTCATDPQTWVVGCSDPSERAPRPSAECFGDPESQRYAARLAGEIGEGLSGYASHPGSAELSVAFDGDARVSEVCFDSYRGGKIASRIPEAAQRVQALPAAPACFAGRRLDFAWESDDVTDEGVRLAVAECRRKVEPHRRKILFVKQSQGCYERKGCSGDEIRRRWDEADRELRSCVLDRVPLVMHTAEHRETLVFAPAEDEKPDPDEAVKAAAVCNGLPRPADVIECMRRRGWEPRATR